MILLLKFTYMRIRTAMYHTLKNKFILAYCMSCFKLGLYWLRI